MANSNPLSTQPYKGARDYYPEDMRLRKYLFDTMRRTAERFGYEEYDAPTLEPIELYLAKSSEEIVSEQTYTIDDRGGRKVVMRPEMTPTVSRLVAGRRQELGYPLRLFNIGGRWRYERPQKGRFREFFQLDVDLFGVDGVAAELEIITVAYEVMKAYGATNDMFTIKVNSRQFINYVLGDYLGFDETQQLSFVRLIDRMAKMEPADFIAQLDALCSPSQREAGAVERLLKVLNAKTVIQLPAAVQDNPALQNLLQLITSLQANGIDNVIFDVTVMRGFDYYTDIVFEVNDTDPSNPRAMYGGGRYDGLVGLFGVKSVPTVGFAMGDAVITEFLKGHELVPELPTETDVYVVLAGDVLNAAQKPIADLRNMGVNVAVDLSGRKLGDQFKTADKKNVTYALVIGEQELTDGQFTLKNLKSGAEEKHSLERIVSIVLRDHPRTQD